MDDKHSFLLRRISSKNNRFVITASSPYIDIINKFAKLNDIPENKIRYTSAGFFTICEYYSNTENMNKTYIKYKDNAINNNLITFNKKEQ